jgi:hypothetical protein
MANLPTTSGCPILRVDFSNDALWAQLEEEITSPTDEGFLADVEFVEDRALAGLDESAIVDALPRSFPDDYEHPVIFVADQVTMTAPDHPLLVVDLHEAAAAKAFRSTPRQVQAIENNLSIANLDYADFANSVDADGIFRGF